MTRDHRYRAYVTLYRDGRLHEKVSHTITARTMREARILANGLAHRLAFDRRYLAGDWSAKVKVGLV